MISRKKIVFILNPISGTRKKSQVPALLKQHLNQQLYSYEIAETARPLHARELAKAAAEAGADIVVAVGGDGTVNEVACGLLYSSSALGILPFGSGNGLARHMGIPVDTIKAIRLLNHPSYTIIDAGEANGKPFFCTAGLGFDAHIGRLFAVTHTRGFASYIRMAMKEYFRFRPHTYHIRSDEGTFKGEYFVVGLANAAQYGNNAYIAPEANIQDGWLNLCLLSPFPAYEVPRLGWQLFHKSIHQNPYMKILRTKEVEISSPQTEYMHIDGEFIPIKESLHIRVLPLSLKIVAPKVKK
ncbi:diacylglycerol/lipid kinase family protein [Nafulsella turpanensis]|uniref:diacylglycerol/lipid kinase family protein n=1 Tax=Nafulsella turpanensis TaxID=1265690 RepID=UPI00034A79C1|nr:YegS/Rv2252/BmrU family lipid kinase [Nafulsella turpanensis]